MKRHLYWAGLGLTVAVTGFLPSLSALHGAAPSTAVARSITAADHTRSMLPPIVAKLLQDGIREGQHHDYARAAASFKRAIALEPNNKLAWYDLGVIAQTQNRASEAIDDYTRAIKADPSFTSALFNEAVLLEPTDPKRAIGLYQRIVAIDPGASTAYLNLGLAYAQRSDHAAAVEAFSRAVAIDSTLRSSVPPAFRDAATAAPTSKKTGVK